MTALVIASGSAVSANNAAFAVPSSGSTIRSDTDVNKSLESMAKLFASAVTDENVRQQIHDGAAQRFDGDTNVLYMTLSNNSDVRGALATAYSRGQGVHRSDALSAVDELASDIPRFQVAVPARFDDWDPTSYTPLVAYMPVGVEDTELETITAYDAMGRAHELDAQVAPVQPVVVLGLNERTDDSGKVLQQTSSFQEPVSSATPTAKSGVYTARVVKVHLIDDNEPWPRGDAEIRLRAQGGGVDYLDPNWTGLNDPGDWWIGNPPDRIVGYTAGDVIFYWWEDDEPARDFTLGFRGVSLQIPMGYGDDLIGGYRVPHYMFQGGSNYPQVWSDLVQWTD